MLDLELVFGQTFIGGLVVGFRVSGGGDEGVAAKGGQQPGQGHMLVGRFRHCADSARWMCVAGDNAA